MTFQTIALSSFPKRQIAAKEVDIEAANALYALIAQAGSENGATDGTVYDSESKARTAARKTVRLLSASPDFQASGAIAHTKVGKPNGSDGFAYAVTITAPEPKGKGK